MKNKSEKHINIENNYNAHKFLYFIYGETYLKLMAKNDTKPSFITYAIPLSYADQIPIYLEIKNNTSKKVISYSIIGGKNPPNRLIKFNIDSLEKDENVIINFCYWVLIKNHKYENLKKDIKIPKQNELPNFTKKFLSPTEAIQSDNILIKIRAKILKGFNNNLFDLVKKVVFKICYHRPILSFIRLTIEKNTFLRDTMLPPQYYTGLMDAVSGLIFGGLCATKANLGVALLRANGIPSRILIVNPIYYRVADFNWIDALHYIIEFYMPEYGWVVANPGEVPHQPKNYVILRIVYPEDETEAGNGLSYYGGMETWFWFSDKNISLDFPREVFTYYKKSKGSGVPITSKKVLNKFKVDEKLADDAYKLTQNSWEFFVKYFGKKFDGKKSRTYNNAIRFQKQALIDLTNSDIENYIKNMKKLQELFKRITI